MADAHDSVDSSLVQVRVSRLLSENLTLGT